MNDYNDSTRPMSEMPPARSLLPKSRNRHIVNTGTGTGTCTDTGDSNGQTLLRKKCIIRKCKGQDNKMLPDIISEDDEVSTQDKSITKKKPRMQNMYPKWEHYSVRYNFYNYKKFNKSLSIHIQYKTPTVFLDGLYFALPRSQILSIHKRSGKSKFSLKVAIPKYGNEKMANVFYSLESFNREFFHKHSNIFNFNKRYTQKAHNLYSDGPQPILIDTTSESASCRSFCTRTPTLSEDEYPEPEKGPIYLDKGSISKKMEYISFYEETNDAFFIKMEIKPTYMAQIISSILKNINSESLYARKFKHILSKIKSEHFEFKASAIDMDLSNDINSIIELWIKCSLFVGDENTREINMKWKICNFKM